MVAVSLAPTVVDTAANKALAQVQPEDFLNYAYATWIGTGFYRVEQRTIWVLRAPFSYMALEPGEKRKWGLKLLLPVTFGFHQFEDIPEDVGTMAFVPGVEFQYPILKNWWVKPYGQIGLGKDFSGGSLAYIYGAGVRTRAIFPWRRFEFSLGGNLMGAGQTISGGGNDNGFSMFEIGIEGLHPTNFTFLGRNTDLSLYFILTEFIDDLDILFPLDNDIKIRRLYKIGATMGFDKPLSIWFIKLPRIGIEYIPGEDMTGIALTMGFPF